MREGGFCVSNLAALCIHTRRTPGAPRLSFPALPLPRERRDTRGAGSGQGFPGGHVTHAASQRQTQPGNPGVPMLPAPSSGQPHCEWGAGSSEPRAGGAGGLPSCAPAPAQPGSGGPPAGPRCETPGDRQPSALGAQRPAGGFSRSRLTWGCPRRRRDLRAPAAAHPPGHQPYLGPGPGPGWRRRAAGPA